MSINASVVWLATIVTLFGRWGKNGFIRYDGDDGEIVYISNVGAKFKSGFILGTVTTGISYFLTLLFTKLYYDTEIQQRFRRFTSLLSLIFCSISSISLILLSILDSINYKRAHYTFAGLFIVFTLLSAILNIVYRSKEDQFSSVLSGRALFIGLCIPLIVVFIVTGAIGGKTSRTNLKSVAATIEWSLALLFVVYIGLFAIDLLIYK
jgi:hypothetical protein